MFCLLEESEQLELLEQAVLSQRISKFSIQHPFLYV